MLQLFVLSIGAIYALIPLVIIIILIAAAVGLTRGSTIFELSGIEALVGMAGAAGAGKAGTGIGGKTMTKMQARTTMTKFGATSAGKTQATTGTLTASAAQKSSTNEVAAGKIRELAQQAGSKQASARSNMENAALTAMTTVGMVNLAVAPSSKPPKSSSRWDKSTNILTTRTQFKEKPLVTMQVPLPLSVWTWKKRASKWRQDQAKTKVNTSRKNEREDYNRELISTFRQHAGKEAKGLMAKAKSETSPLYIIRDPSNPQRFINDPTRSFAAFRVAQEAAYKKSEGTAGAQQHDVRYEDWVAYKGALPPSPPPPLPQTMTWKQAVGSFYKGSAGAVKRKLKE